MVERLKSYNTIVIEDLKNRKKMKKKKMDVFKCEKSIKSKNEMNQETTLINH